MIVDADANRSKTDQSLNQNGSVKTIFGTKWAKHGNKNWSEVLEVTEIHVCNLLRYDPYDKAIRPRVGLVVELSGALPLWVRTWHVT